MRIKLLITEYAVSIAEGANLDRREHLVDTRGWPPRPTAILRQKSFHGAFDAQHAEGIPEGAGDNPRACVILGVARDARKSGRR